MWRIHGKLDGYYFISSHMELARTTLEHLYIKEKKPISTIAKLLGCSEHKVNYWVIRFGIPKRSISESVYLHYNPRGDPFRIREPKTLDEAFLSGLGLGLYWGEGTKSNKNTVRLGNTDPRLIAKFIEFLTRLFEIDRKKLRFGLQILSDMAPEKALKFWINELGVSESQFQKVIVTPARGIGTYRHKTKHGVLTIYFCNKKLRDIICQMIEDMP